LLKNTALGFCPEKLPQKDSIMPVKRLARIADPDHSPCVGHCTYDNASFCRLCRRSSDEAVRWRKIDDRARKSAWARIPASIDEAGVAVMRLPLDPDDIAEIARETLAQGGMWGVGTAGHWVYGHDLIGDDGGVLSAASGDGLSHITLDLSGRMRVMAWARGGRKFDDGVNDLPVLIVVPRARLKDAPPVKVTHDGDDLVIETWLATARQKNAAHATGLMPNSAIDAAPPDLTLPESYVLAAVLLPKDEPPLG
jgi:predicted Fe-S protein YdhL (DUF1289 family)